MRHGEYVFAKGSAASERLVETRQAPACVAAICLALSACGLPDPQGDYVGLATHAAGTISRRVPDAIAVDGAGNIYVSTDVNETAVPPPTFEFSPRTDLDSAPLGTIKSFSADFSCGELAAVARGDVLCLMNEAVAPARRTASIANSSSTPRETNGFSPDPCAASPVGMMSADAIPHSANVRYVSLDRAGYLNLFGLNSDTGPSQGTTIAQLSRAQGPSVPTVYLVEIPVLL
jgi:hypothetical protein